MRQTAFDNWETTDDHGMIIYGIAKDQNGKEYFMVKNSWGTNNKYKGTWYASKAFCCLQNYEYSGSQRCPSQGYRKETGN